MTKHHVPQVDQATHAARGAHLISPTGTQAAGGECGTLTGDDFSLYEREYDRLRAQLSAEAERSPLPDVPTAAAALKDLLRRVRADGAADH